MEVDAEKTSEDTFGVDGEVGKLGLAQGLGCANGTPRKMNDKPVFLGVNVMLGAEACFMYDIIYQLHPRGVY